MQLKMLKSFVLPTLLGIVALATGIYFMPKVNPFFVGVPDVSRTQARSVVTAFATQQGLNLDDYYSDSYFIYSASDLDYLIRTFGLQQTFGLSREEKLPLSYWQFRYYRNVPNDNQVEEYHFRVQPDGTLLGYAHSQPDSLSGKHLSIEQARMLADSAMAQWPGVMLSDYTLKSQNTIEKPARADHTFQYEYTPQSYGEGKRVILVRVAGDHVSQIWPGFQEPADFLSASGVVGGPNLLFNVASVAIYVFLTVLMIVVFLRKYHEGEVGVRRGLIAAGLLLLVNLVSSINMWGMYALGTGLGAISWIYVKFIIFALNLVTTYTIMSINVLTGWVAGFHEIRQQKPSILNGITSILKRSWISRNIGKEIPIGFVAGTTIFGGINLLNYALIHLFGAHPRLSLQSFASFTYYLPVLGIVAVVLFFALLSEITFRAFLVPYLRRRLKSTALAIIISGVTYGFFGVFFSDHYSFWPTFFTVIPLAVFGIAQAVVFWRYGLLASMTSGALFLGYEATGPLFASQAAFYTANGIATVGLYLGLLAVGLIGLLRGKAIEMAFEEEPAHIRRIKERTRLQKELEIARRVQLGLLPKEQPRLSGFDIAGICMPAQEVGGDYFDFIQLKNGNLGIAVGDVSGKGVPAAIYMTLTKGILQSHAEGEASPKEVLSKVNHLMYRTIEKSWYVSMFYAVLDAERRRLRFARAGHNPAIVLQKDRNEPQMLQTAGIGLGLDFGEIFTKMLVEGELVLQSGDTLVFYTDGFPEAMNADGDEFGEQRFLDVIRHSTNGSAQELMRRVIATVQEFADGAPQHDDMTMVVLKVY